MLQNDASVGGAPCPVFPMTWTWTMKWIEMMCPVSLRLFFILVGSQSQLAASRQTLGSPGPGPISGAAATSHEVSNCDMKSHKLRSAAKTNHLPREINNKLKV